MDTIRIPRSTHTKLIAHRGLSGLECENTCAAFVAAGNRDYFGIETDIHPTADGQYILIHDNNTGRVAVEDLPVESSTLAALRAVALKDTDGQPRGDLQTPLPEEYLRICRKYQKVGVLEFKGRFTKEQLAEVRGLVAEYYDESGLVYISFDYANLCDMRELAPDAKIQYLCGDLTEEQLQDMVARRIDVDAYFPTLNADKIAHMHELGLEVNCWTVDSPEDAQRLIQDGVDYITSNILQYAE